MSLEHLKSGVPLSNAVVNKLLEQNPTASLQALGITGDGTTDLSWDAGTGTITSSTGANATLTLSDATNAGLMSSAQFSKLAGIESGATADQTGAEIKTAYESNADTNAYTDSEKAKVAGIESNADVTDDASVAAAGALMESAVSDPGGIKTLTVPDSTTISAFGSGLVAAATDAAARSALQLDAGTVDLSLQALTADVAKYTADTFITDASTARTLTNADHGRTILFTAGTAVTVTVPAGLELNFWVTMMQMGSGQITVSAATGVVLNTAISLTTSAQYTGISAANYGQTDTYLVSA